MGIRLIFALLVVIVLFTPAPTRGLQPVCFQLQPTPKGYGDSPRPGPIPRLHRTEAASAKFLLRKVEPEYPHEAEAAGVVGDVVFRIIVGAKGTVEEIHLRRGRLLLVEAAAKAVSEWQYETSVVNGKPVEVDTFATVRFRLPSKHQ
jgi:TonB family protein